MEEKTNATLREKRNLMRDLETDSAHIRNWLEAVSKHAEAADHSHIASREAHIACMKANGVYCEEDVELLPERPRVEISWESYVHLIALAEIGIGMKEWDD